MKYQSYDIVFQEVPDEVTLAVNISGCPNRCDGCHSPHLQKDEGEILDESLIENLIHTYGNAITCICFMGGDAYYPELENLATFIHSKTELKVAWYSGRDNLPEHPKLFQYVKLGPYIPKRGGLASKETNQRLYRIDNGVFENITYKLWKKV